MVSLRGSARTLKHAFKVSQMVRTNKITEKNITLIHGAGGAKTLELVKDLILHKVEKADAGGIGLTELDDGATIPVGDRNLVLTTDSHVVKPIFFPGGDIGKLAVAGTINDLAVMGAKPLAMTLSLIIEEGFPRSDLDKITESITEVLKETDTALITGDTKVMGKGEVDELVVNTTGLGIADRVICDSGLEVGDNIMVTGWVGDHGMALLARREGMNFETDLTSDVAPLSDLISEALSVGGITAMKDPTRGGLANALNEMAQKSGVGITIEEAKIPLREEVKGLAEILGINPLEVGNEGKAVMGVKKEKTQAVLKVLKKNKKGVNAQIVGQVTNEHRGKVILETEVGGRRFLEPPSGDPIPRIC